MSKAISFLPINGKFPFINQKIECKTRYLRLESEKYQTPWFKNLKDAAEAWNSLAERVALYNAIDNLYALELKKESENEG